MGPQKYKGRRRKLWPMVSFRRGSSPYDGIASVFPILMSDNLDIAAATRSSWLPRVCDGRKEKNLYKSTLWCSDPTSEMLIIASLQLEANSRCACNLDVTYLEFRTSSAGQGHIPLWASTQGGSWRLYYVLGKECFTAAGTDPGIILCSCPGIAAIDHASELMRSGGRISSNCLCRSSWIYIGGLFLKPTDFKLETF